MVFQKQLVFSTQPRTSHNISEEVQAVVKESKIKMGQCHLFVKHTSASLMLCENADPDVRRDLETFMAQTVPDGSPLFLHSDEGPDDMSAHIRTILTNPDLTIPVTNGRCNLGTWQGIYLWEHRMQQHHRQLVVTVMGE